ncbi:MAG: FixH family protein [Pseudohongiellaceae bacterium]
MNKFSYAITSLFLITSSTNIIRGDERPELTARTESGWTIYVDTSINPLRINTMHSWQIRVIDSESKPVTMASVSIEGGMPEHDHGLPTQPKVTSEISPGTYLLQGVRFHMPGRWEIKFTISRESQKELGIASIQL